MFALDKFQRRKTILALAIVASWTAFGLFFGVQNYISDLYAGRAIGLSNYLINWLLCGYSWGLLTVPVARFVRRFSVARLGWSAFFLIHIPASAVFASIALGVFVVLTKLLLGVRGSVLEFYEYVFVNAVQSEVLVYFLIVGVVTFFEGRFVRDRAPAIDEIEKVPVAANGHDLPGAGRGYLKRLSIKNNGRIALIDIEAVEWIASYGNYLKINTGNSRFLHRETMNDIEQKLDPQRFVRVRRSTIVSVDHVQELRPISNGEFEVVLKNGTVVNSTRRYRKNLQSLMNG